MKVINATDKVKIGDVFVYSWGYDQTNINFFQVIGKTKKSIKVREIRKVTEETGFMCGNATPIKNSFKNDEVKIKRPYEYPKESNLAGTIYFNQRYGSCQLWDGTPQGCSWYA